MQRKGQSVVSIIILVVLAIALLWMVKWFLLSLGLFLLLAGGALVGAILIGSKGDGQLATYMLVFAAVCGVLHLFVAPEVTLLSILGG